MTKGWATVAAAACEQNTVGMAAAATAKPLLLVSVHAGAGAVHCLPAGVPDQPRSAPPSSAQQSSQR